MLPAFLPRAADLLRDRVSERSSCRRSSVPAVAAPRRGRNPLALGVGSFSTLVWMVVVRDGVGFVARAAAAVFFGRPGDFPVLRAGDLEASVRFLAADALPDAAGLRPLDAVRLRDADAVLFERDLDGERLRG